MEVSLRLNGRGCVLSAVNETKHGWHKQQRCNSSKDQTADNGSTERRILLPALAQPERHGHHPDNHRECRHQHWTKACEACLGGCSEGIVTSCHACAGVA